MNRDKLESTKEIGRQSTLIKNQFKNFKIFLQTPSLKSYPETFCKIDSKIPVLEFV